MSPVLARVLAGIVSLAAPGAGHFVLGERVRARLFTGLGVVLMVALPFAVWPVLWALLALRLAAAGDVLVGVRIIRPANAIGMAVSGATPLAMIVCLWAVAVELYRVPSSSMVPTAGVNSHLVVNRLAYLVDTPARGEVIAFRNPCAPVTFTKRIVAVGGDTVEVRCNVLHVNGVAAPEQLVLAEGCGYDDYDAQAERWARPACARYREHDYGTLHGADRPERDRELAVARAAGTATYLEDGPDDFMDWHDFPELPKSDAMGRLRARAEPRGPRLPTCPRGGASGVIEVLTAPEHWEPWRDQPWPDDGFPGPADPCGPRARYRVPAGHVFVMGDNRQNASDSRVWGPVSTSAIIGEVVAIY